MLLERSGGCYSGWGRRGGDTAGPSAATAPAAADRATARAPFAARGFDSDYPNVIMVLAISDAAVASRFFDRGWHSAFIAGTKNVAGMKETLWRCMGEGENTLLRIATADRGSAPPAR